MKGINSITKQKGVFSIEFAMVAFFMGLMLLFVKDSVIALSTRGKINRVSFSVVSLFKERTQLFTGTGENVDNNEIDLLYLFIKQSLGRTINNFSESNLKVIFQQYGFPNRHQKWQRGSAGYECKPKEAGQDFSPITHNAQRRLLYQVTLCYKNEPFMGNTEIGDAIVHSDAISLSR
ncbi:tight adherence pilus pseudopilin TadF [Dongshaea marina]|uniref:tight adherence pilus pseudopilin TadF n=1 Tax=Dongshaea marina TaxID=2047966 RepID=UPI000D3EDE0A|nr:tight adherence pilus pseudopilin TadF [Dongshaea marina]